MVKLILRQDVDKLGRAGDIINVKDGFARNFLIPNNLALPATPGNLKRLEQQKQSLLKTQEEIKKKAEELAQRISATSFTIAAQVHEGDKLYGGISSSEISGALEEEGFSIDKKNILLNEPIKSLGVYEVPVKLHPQVESKIKIWVVKK